MSTIFACTDLGPESDKVIMSAINLSKILNTNVRILFLDEVSPVYFGPDISLPYFPNYVEVKEWNAKISEPVLARIEQQLKRLQLTKAQLKIEIIDATGFKKFDSFLQTNDCSLLMIGASQKSGIERIMLGSFLEKAIFNLTVNLMVIKNLITAAPKNIALSIDIEHDDGLIVGQACRLAKLFNTGVNLLHFVNYTSLDIVAQEYSDVIKTYVETKRREAEYKVAKWHDVIVKEGVPCHKTVYMTCTDNVEGEISQYVQKENIELLFVEPHPGILKGFKFNSTTLPLLKHANTNFFVVKGFDVIKL